MTVYSPARGACFLVSRCLHLSALVAVTIVNRAFMYFNTKAKNKKLSLTVKLALDEGSKVDRPP
jgi:hypothetical protein